MNDNYFNILRLLVIKEIQLSEEEQKNILSFIFDNQNNPDLDMYEVENFLYTIIENQKWLPSFCNQIFIDRTNFNENIQSIFLPFVKINNKKDFIEILKNTRCHNFFKLYFEKFNYNTKEKKIISELFNFSPLSIFCFYFDHEIKINIFKKLGLIPSLISCSNINDVNDEDFKLLIQHFNLVNIKDQLNIVIDSFYFSISQKKYKNTNLYFYKYFYKQLENENNNVINFLLSKQRNKIEEEFLKLALPVKEQINFTSNIKNF